MLLIVIAFSLDSRDCGNQKPAGEMKVLWWVVHLIVTIIIVGGTVTCYDNNDENKTIETRGEEIPRNLMNHVLELGSELLLL